MMSGRTSLRVGGDGQEIEVESFNLSTVSEAIGPGAFVDHEPRYITGLRETTLSFEGPLVDLGDLHLFADRDLPCDLSLVHEYRWSRWRRWLNGFLRFMWWPLGPPKLPHDVGIGISGMYVTVAHRQDDGTFHVAMSSRKPES